MPWATAPLLCNSVEFPVAGQLGRRHSIFSTSKTSPLSRWRVFVATLVISQLNRWHLVALGPGLLREVGSGSPPFARPFGAPKMHTLVQRFPCHTKAQKVPSPTKDAGFSKGPCLASASPRCHAAPRGGLGRHQLRRLRERRGGCREMATLPEAPEPRGCVPGAACGGAAETEGRDWKGRMMEDSNVEKHLPNCGLGGSLAMFLKCEGS